VGAKPPSLPHYLATALGDAAIRARQTAIRDTCDRTSDYPRMRAHAHARVSVNPKPRHIASLFGLSTMVGGLLVNAKPSEAAGGRRPHRRETLAFESLR